MSLAPRPAPPGAAGPHASGDREAAACFAEALVCHRRDERLEALHLRRRGDRLEVRALPLDGPAAVAVEARRLGRRCPVVVLLPKSAYMLRVVELPAVPPAEVAAMLDLEVEASLPPEFGPVEMSYCALEPLREGYRRYEAYIARREDLAAVLAGVETLGLRCDYVVPSALAWRQWLHAKDAADLLVAASADGGLEVASLEPDRSLALRMIRPVEGARRQEAVHPGLLEHLRSMLGRGGRAGALSVGWIGPACPAALSDGRVLVQDLDRHLPGSGAEVGEGGPAPTQVDPLLRVAAIGLSSLADRQALRTGNMLPRQTVSARQRRAVRGAVGTAVLCALLSVMVVWAALRVAASRCERAAAELDRRTAPIRAEGEVVGRSLAQLRAVSAARATRHHLHDVLAGLCEAVPADDLSFSEVQLDEAGVLALRGQAQSLSRPYELPEQLERQAIFTHALLRDAGQVARGGGTVTEFHLECRLSRPDVP